MAYELLFQPRARKEFLTLPPDIAKKIAQALHTLEQEPRSSQSVKLSGGGGHRLRVGTYRILYEIDETTKRVIVYRVKHRREAYR